MTQNSDWHKRKIAIDQELGGHSEDTVDVRVVQWDAFRGSRERAAVARAFGSIAAPGAGVHAGFSLGAVDLRGQSDVWIHQVIVSSSCIVALAQTAAITLASEGGVSPGWRDTDPELIPQIFENTIAAADLPTAVTATIPQFTSALAGTNFSFTVSAGMPGMFHFRTSSALPFRLFFFNATAATALHYQAQWQAIRP